MAIVVRRQIGIVQRILERSTLWWAGHGLKHDFKAWPVYIFRER